MSRLGLGLGLTKGGVIPFNPLSLDPYLLFDTQSSMIGTFENPTLDLDPANPSTLDVITATRAGVATYTDADGLIQSASADTVRVDYTQGAELTPTKFQNVVQTDYSASPNGGFNMNLTDIDGPEGASGGVRVSETAANGQHYLSIDEIPVVSGQSYTVSFYIKEGAYSSVGVYTQSSKINSNVNFNFSTGTATFGGSDLTANSGSVSTVGGGWYRVSYSAIASNGGLMSLYVTVKDLSSYAGDVNNFTDYYGFQVEEGTTASSFVANTSGSPKFIASAVYGPRVAMILVEPSSENLITRSEDFSQSYWTKSGSSVASGQTSPTGDTSAYKLVEDTSSGEHKVSTGIITVSAGTTDTYSVFVKKAGRTKIAIREEQHGGKYVSFNLLSKTVISNTGLTANIIDLSDDWLRIDYSQNSGGGLEKFSLFLLDDAYTAGSPTAHSYTGDGTSGVYIWGAQLEAGSVATSYIPTSGGNAAARTRAADDLVISGSDFSDFYNQSEGTFYVESELQRATEASFQPFLFSADNGDANRLGLYYESGGGVRGFVKASNVEHQLSLGTHPAVDTLSRTAFSYKTNNLRGSRDGSSVTPLTTAVIPTTVSKLDIGSHLLKYTHLYFNGHIKRLIYWPTHSSRL